MPPHNPKHLLQCEESQNVLIVRFLIQSIREDRDIGAIFKELETLIGPGGHHRMVVSFHKVTSIASYFIGVFVVLNNTMQRVYALFVLCDLPPVVQEIVDLMQLSRQFEIRKTELDALTSFE